MQEKKNSQNSFRSSDKGISKYCNKLSLLRREYLSAAVNGLLNNPKILNITKRDVFNLSCLHRDQ